MSLVDRLIRYCLENKLIVFILLALLVGLGLYYMPFDVELGRFPATPSPSTPSPTRATTSRSSSPTGPAARPRTSRTR